MNKAELIEVLTKRMDADRRAAADAVENVVDAIVRAVAKGESVTITGFGVFERRRRAARVARNPRTGETVKVKPTSAPAFRPGAQFKAIVSGAQKLPSAGPAVKRGTGPGAVRKAPVKKAPANKVTAVKKAAPVSKTVAKKAPVRAAAVKKAPAKKAVVVTKAPARKMTVAKKTPVRAAAVKMKKTPAKKAVVVTKAPAKKAVVVTKAPAKKAVVVTKAQAKKAAPVKGGRR